MTKQPHGDPFLDEFDDDDDGPAHDPAECPGCVKSLAQATTIMATRLTNVIMAYGGLRHDRHNQAPADAAISLAGMLAAMTIVAVSCRMAVTDLEKAKGLIRDLTVAVTEAIEATTAHMAENIKVELIDDPAPHKTH